MYNKLLPILFLILFSYNLNAQNNLEKVKLAVHWTPQAQFAGYYAGVEKGIYKKYGLDVEIIHTGPGKTSQEMLISRKVNFATMFLSTAMFLTSDNTQLINICQLSQKSAQMFLVKKKSNIKKPSDFQNKSVAIWGSGFDELPEAFKKQFDLKLDFVKADSPTNIFIFDATDAMTAMWYNEYHSVLSSGYNSDELELFFFSDYDLNVPEDGIYCLEENYNKHIAKKLRDATIEAWQYAFMHKEEVMEITKKIMNQHHTPFNKPHQMWMLSRMEDLFEFNKPGKHLGNLKKTDFQNAVEIYSSLGKLITPIIFNDFYRGE